MKELLGLLSAVFAALAAWLIYSAETLVVSVEVEGSEIANLQLMQAQSNLYGLGIGAGIIAAVLLVGCALKSPSSSPD